jgi:hypothetical protein
MINRLALFLLLSTVACQRSPAGKVQASAVASVSIDTIPELDIAAIDTSGAVVFMNVTDATRLSSGVIVVADRGGPSLRFLTPRGALVREVGRKGTGPGEFQILHWLEQCGTDAIYAWDPWQARMTVFDSAGRLVRQFSFPARPSDWSCNSQGISATLSSVQGFALESETAPPMTAELATFARDGVLLHSFGRITMRKNRPLAAVAAIVVAGDRLYFGGGDSTLVTVTTLTGNPISTVVLGVAGRPVTQAMYEATIDHSLLDLIRAEDREPLRKYLLKVPAPDHLPAFRALLADPTGAVWAVTSPFGAGVTELQGIDSLGHALGVLRLPRDLVVREIGRDYLLALAESGEGEQHVLLYRLHR